MARMHLSPQHFALAFFMWTFSLILALPVSSQQADKPASPASAPAKEAPENDNAPNEWSVRTYLIPTEKLKALKLPEMPEGDTNADAKAIQKFIRESTKVSSDFLDGYCIRLPEGSLVVADVARSRIFVRTTGKWHNHLRLFTHRLAQHIPHHFTCRVNVFAVKLADTNKVLSSALGSADHTTALDYLHAQAGKGNVQLLSSNLVNTPSGQTAELMNQFRRLPEEKEKTGEDTPGSSTLSNIRPSGLNLELTPITGIERTFIDLDYDLRFEYTLALPADGKVPPAGEAAKGAGVEVPIESQFTARAHSNINLRDGQSRLIGIWDAKESSPNNSQILAFLTGNITYLVPDESPIPVNWLKIHGDKVAPIPESSPDDDKASGQAEMMTRRYFIPPLLISKYPDSNPPDEPRSAIDYLKSINIPFPPGAFAEFLVDTNELVVRNTEPNLSLVDTLVSSLVEAEGIQHQFVLRIVETDGPTLRKLDRKAVGLADHAPFWNKLIEQIDSGQGRIIRTAWAESSPGLPLSVAAGNGYASKPEAPAIAESDRESNFVGLQLEVLPMGISDGNMANLELNLKLKLHTATPDRSPTAPKEKPAKPAGDSVEFNFHKYQLHSNLIIRTGTARMIALWKPKGDPKIESKDVLRAAFLEARIIELQPPVSDNK